MGTGKKSKHFLTWAEVNRPDLDIIGKSRKNAKYGNQVRDEGQGLDASGIKREIVATKSGPILKAMWGVDESITKPNKPIKNTTVKKKNIKFAGGRVVRKGFGKVLSKLGIIKSTKEIKRKTREELFTNWQTKQVNIPKSER